MAKSIRIRALFLGLLSTVLTGTAHASTYALIVECRTPYADDRVELSGSLRLQQDSTDTYSLKHGFAISNMTRMNVLTKASNKQVEVEYGQVTKISEDVTAASLVLLDKETSERYLIDALIPGTNTQPTLIGTIQSNQMPVKPLTCSTRKIFEPEFSWKRLRDMPIFPD